MRKFLFFAASLICSASAYGQSAQQAAEAATKALMEAKAAEQTVVKPQYWTTSAKLSVGLSQTALINWAAGGYNSFTLLAGADLIANYKKDHQSWNNRLQMDYGALWSQDKAKVLQITADRLYLESKWALDMSEKSKWKYTAGIDFKTQFSDNYSSYTEAGGKDLKSSFMSPAYTNIALGMEWQPNDWFNVTIAPLTGGLVICTDTRSNGNGVPLRKNYGMKANGDFYDPVLFQFGAQVKANAKVTINDVLTLESQLVIFTDYLERPFIYNRINWDNFINWRISKLISLGLKTWLIYDPIVLINGVQRVQFKEFLSFSLSYTIRNKK